ncbi:MAG TPA: NAD(P)-dependent oxidoreductase [Herpetosiphonaceae bacterium]|nr:NAD(P)-dependent oxidoreductase [Herpetosiphonaceae bacterium]
MRVVVTGGSGRAGQYVVRAVAEAGHQVVNFDMIRPLVDLPGEFCRVDLTNLGEVYDAIFQFRPEGVCHLAANPSPGGQARVDVFDNNVLSAFNMLQSSGDARVRRVIYASSEMATGLLTDGVVPSQIPFDESERRPSPNAYALSKYISEVIADSLSLAFPETAFVGLRINNVIPPDRYDILQARRDNPATGLANFWSYIDARDVGTAYLAALQGESTSHEVFLIAAPDTSADRPLRELMAEYYDGYDRFAPDHDEFASAFNCSKMERFFGWKPSYSWRQEQTNKQ